MLIRSLADRRSMTGRQMPRRHLRAVTFDFFDTLFYEYDQAELSDAYVRQVATWLRARGREHADTEVRHALRDAARAQRDRMRDMRQLSADGLISSGLDSLNVRSTAAERRQLLDAMADPWPTRVMRPALGIHEALSALARAGLGLGLVSNTGIRSGRALLRHLVAAGLAQLFAPAAIAWSDDVGWRKPDPRIFWSALQGLGCQPEEAVHVGDSRQADVVGALGMGMIAVRYHGIVDDEGEGPEGHHVIADHRELLSITGIAM